MEPIKEECMVKVKEKLDDLQLILLADIKKLLNSGGIDIDSYVNKDNEINPTLIKVLITASIERQGDVMRPYQLKYRDDINNLVQM